MDEFNNETSFDTITTDRLFVTLTEDHFPLNTAKQTQRHSK